MVLARGPSWLLHSVLNLNNQIYLPFVDKFLCWPGKGTKIHVVVQV